jgi:hypothetical protein
VEAQTMKVTVPRQAPWPDNFIVGEQSFDADFEAIASVSELRLQRLRRPA